MTGLTETLQMATARYRQNIERFAQRIGQTPDRLLVSIREQARLRRQSGDQCYSPDEIVEYERKLALPKGRQGHMETCPGCAALISVLTPILSVIDLRGKEISPPERLLSITESRRARPLAELIWSYPTIGVAATLLCIGIFSAWTLQRRFDAGPTEVRITFPGRSGDESVNIPVKVHNGKLTSDSYIHVAAAAAVAEGAAESNKPEQEEVQGFVNVSLGPDDLRTVSNALAAALQEHSDPAILDTPQERSDQKQDLLRALVQSFASSNVKVIPSSNGEVCLYRNDECVAFVRTDNALNLTETYATLLKTNKGDTAVLDSHLKDVSFSFVAGGREKDGLPKH